MRVLAGGAASLAAVLVLLAPGCGSAGDREAETSGVVTASGEDAGTTGAPEDRKPTVESISQTVSRLRGLPLTGEISVSYITREQLQLELEAEIDQEYPPAEVRADERALKLLGLLAPEDDLEAELTRLLGEGVVGFYDDETRQLKIVSDTEEIDALNEITLAHEITHALQDQHFPLGPFMAGAAGGDQEVARLALVEGEATMVEEEYMQLAMGGADLAEALLGSLGMMGAVGDTPPFLVDSLEFPYLEGREFVAFLREQEEWEAVNEAYGRPPASTEQILHPEKYLIGEAPVPVSVPDLAPLAGEGWAVVSEDSLGEFDLIEILRVELPGGRSRRAAEGWGGGAYRLYQRGDEAMLAILTVWDTPGDADEFSLALGESLEKRFAREFEMAAAVPQLMTAGGEWSLAQRGNAVAAVFSPQPGSGAAAVKVMLGI